MLAVKMVIRLFPGTFRHHCNESIVGNRRPCEDVQIYPTPLVDYIELSLTIDAIRGLRKTLVDDSSYLHKY